MARRFLSIATVLIGFGVQQSSGENVTSILDYCDLDCENDGTCEYVSGEEETLKRLFQEGQLIQRCACPDGFTGTGCELEQTECIWSTMTCFNGVACEENSFGDMHCDCAMAAAISSRAVQMCRRTYTEYCSSEFKANAPISFCTNGGKCKGSLLAARIAPGNTTINANFEHAGCICPSEFYGPHCEFLHHSSSSSNPVQASPGTASNNSTGPTPAPTAYTTITMYPTTPEFDGDSAKTVEDIINSYDNSAENGSGSSDGRKMSSKSRLLLSIFLSILFAVGLVCFSLAILVYRHKKQKQKGCILSNPSSASNIQKSTTSTKGTRGIVLKPILHEGTADLTPFVFSDKVDKDLIADDDDDDDDGTLWTEPDGCLEDSSTSNTIKSGWVKQKVKRGKSSKQGSALKVDNCRNSKRCDGIDEYIVGDVEDDVAYVVGGNKDTDDGNSYLENYRQHAYMVGGDDEEDVCTVSSISAWGLAAASNTGHSLA